MALAKFITNMIAARDQNPVVTPHTSVLLVEDEAISRRALSVLLRSSGYQPIPVRSAEEAIALIRSGKFPQLAVVDLDLPGINGIQLIQWLAGLEPAVPAILISASNGEALRRLSDRAHVPYFPKPLNINNLLNFLAREEASA